MSRTSEVEAQERAVIPQFHVLDVDGHEFAPPHLWGDIFGPVAARLAEVCAPFIQAMGEDYIHRPAQAADDNPMTRENVWTMRHSGAPGAFDMERRLQAMDLMGVRKQLIFPSYGLWGQILSTPEGGWSHRGGSAPVPWQSESGRGRRAGLCRHR